jgi:hypothetical protein
MLQPDRPEITMLYSACALRPGSLRLQTHTHNMQHLLLFHYNNGCKNAPRCYVYTYIGCLVFHAQPFSPYQPTSSAAFLQAQASALSPRSQLHPVAILYSYLVSFITACHTSNAFMYEGRMLKKNLMLFRWLQ